MASISVEFQETERNSRILTAHTITVPPLPASGYQLNVTGKLLSTLILADTCTSATYCIGVGGFIAEATCPNGSGIDFYNGSLVYTYTGATWNLTPSYFVGDGGGIFDGICGASNIDLVQSGTIFTALSCWADFSCFAAGTRATKVQYNPFAFISDGIIESASSLVLLPPEVDSVSPGVVIYHGFNLLKPLASATLTVTGKNFIPGGTSLFDATGEIAYSNVYCTSTTTCTVTADYSNLAFNNGSLITDLRAATLAGESPINEPGDVVSFVYVAPPPPPPPSFPPANSPTSCAGGQNPSGCDNPNPCNTGDPIYCETGNFWQTDTDIQVNGEGLPLSLSRTYNSVENSTNGPFGFGWSCSYCMSLSVNSATGDVTINQENGSTVSFFPNGNGGYETAGGVFATLTKNSNGSWTFVRKRKVTYSFDPTGRLVSESDLNGNVSKMSYNSSGQLASITDASGRSITVTNDASNHIVSASDPMGRTWSYGYDAAGDLVSVTDPAGGQTTYAYDSSHNLTTMTNPDGGVTTNTYGTISLSFDPVGTLPVVAQVDPMGSKTAFSYSGDPYSGSGGTTTVTDPKGNMEVETYTDGVLTALSQGVTTPDDPTSTFTYDPTTGGIASIADPNGKTWAYTYNSFGDLLSSTDPLSHTVTNTYDSLGDLLTSRDPSGETTTYAYDSNGNLLSSTQPDSATGQTLTTTYGYGSSSHPGEIRSLTDPNGNTWHFAYDANGDVASMTDPLGDATTYSYNADGEKTAVVASDGNHPGANPANFTTSYSYDPDGRLVKSLDPLGNATTVTYDKNGNQVTSIDPEGNITTTAYDPDGEVASTKGANGARVSYAYDPDGNVLSSTDQNGNTTTYTYDSLNRATSTTNPLGQVTTFHYDPAGNESSKMNPDGVVTTMGYDATDHLISVTSSNPAIAAVSYTYDAEGRRVSMADGTGTTTYSYDSVGRLLRSTNGAGATVSYAYNPAGHMVSMTYPNGKTVTYSYDPVGRMSKVTDWDGNMTSYTYDASGYLTSQGFPNGITEANSYNSAGELTSMADSRGSTTLASESYGRNVDGLVSNQAVTGIPSPTPDQSYSYSAVQELIGANGSTYGYDPAGNLTSMSGGTTLSYNAANELHTTSSGGMTTDYAYDGEGNLVGQVGPGVGAQACVLCLLSPTSDGALSVNGNATISADGSIAVDSSSTQAVSATGGAAISARQVFVAGSTRTTGTAAITNLQPSGSGIAISPFGNLRVPMVSASPQALSLTGYSSQTAQPGVYSSISVTGNAKLTLSPGTYVVTGGVRVTGSGSLSGQGVSLDLECSGYPILCPAGSNRSGIDVSGSGQVTLTKGAFGPGQGITIYADSNNASAIDVTGNGVVSSTGSIDAPAVNLDASGTASINVTSGVMVAATTGATGTASVKVQASVSGTLTTSYTVTSGLGGIQSPTLDASYIYDGAGLRQSAVINGTTVHFDWSTVGTYPELLSDGTNYYVYGASGTPVEQVSQTTGTPTYLFSDELGSVIMLADQTGNVVGTSSYTPYGAVNETTGTTTTPFGFDGGYADPSGLIYDVTRYYDPSIGQFISADPLEAQTGAPYSYAKGNPVNGGDPTGLATVGECLGASVFAAYGFAGLVEGTGCLTRTVSGGVDEIGFTGAAGGGAGFGVGAGASVGAFYQVSSALHLDDLGKWFDVVVLSGQVEVAGASVSVFWTTDPNASTQVYGIEVGLSIGPGFGGFGVIGRTYTWVDASLPWGMGTVADGVWDALNPDLAVSAELSRAQRDIAIAENQSISTSGSPKSPGPCSG